MAGPTGTRITYAALFVLNVMIGAFLLQVGKGAVPFPASMEWTVPIIVAALNAITWFLPRIGSEQIAGRVNELTALGVPKSRIRVHDARNPEVAA